MSRAIVPIVFLVVMIASCGGVSQEEQAMLAASGYYTHLVSGEYAEFLQGRADSDSLPEDYRAQLEDGLRQFVALQQSEHGGITKVESTRAVRDTTMQLMQVFLLLHYADSTHEEIVVPMVQRGEVWRMR